MRGVWCYCLCLIAAGMLVIPTHGIANDGHIKIAGVSDSPDFSHPMFRDVSIC